MRTTLYRLCGRIVPLLLIASFGLAACAIDVATIKPSAPDFLIMSVGRTMQFCAPLNPTAEALGATVEPGSSPSTFIVSKGENKIAFALRYNYAIVNDKQAPLAFSPMMDASTGLLYVPAMALVEGLGGSASVDQDNLQVNVKFPDSEATVSFAFDPNQKISGTSITDRNSELYAMDLDGKGLRRLTYNTSKENLPYISPDGQLLVFSRGDRLTIRKVDDPTEKVIMPPPEDKRVKCLYIPYGFTADSSSVIFVAKVTVGTKQSSYIVRVKTDGTGSERLCEGGDTPAINPDGSTIAYTVPAVPKAGTAAGTGAPSGGWSPDGSTGWPGPGGNGGWPGPGGYGGWPGPGGNGGWPGPGGGSYTTPTSGAVTSISRTITSHIWLMDSNGEHPRDLGIGDSPVFSPDGNLLVYAKPVPLPRGGTANLLVTYVLKGKGVGKTIAPTNPQTRQGPEGFPKFKQDGTRVIFLNIRGISVVAADQRVANMAPLPQTFPRGTKSSPSYTPDGKGMLFIQNGELYRSELKQDPKVVKLTSEFKVESYRISPDGNVIFLQGVSTAKPKPVNAKPTTETTPVDLPF